MIGRLKRYIKDRVIGIAKETAIETTTNLSKSISTDVSNEIAKSVAHEVARQTSIDISENIILNKINPQLEEVNNYFSQITHSIFEIMKVLNGHKNNVTQDNLWDICYEKKVGLFLGEVRTVSGKTPINGFFGGGINTVLSKYPLEVLGQKNPLDSVEMVAFWGQSSHIHYLPLLYNILLKQKEILFLEDGFFYNVLSHTKSLTGEFPSQLTVGCSFTIDKVTSHFDASLESSLEKKITSEDIVKEEELARVRKLIQTIKINKLTKYNYQSMDDKIYGDKEKKVLVIDQAYGDYSVYKSSANENIFKKMLKEAILENPDADILVKVHPDMVANPNRAGAKNGGYFANMEIDSSQVILIREEINPYIILEQVHSVYVCSSQMGFEALLSGKTVYVYGVPFYAGWGVTVDRGNKDLLHKRSNKTRTVEELFWYSYIWYSRYYNPEAGEECSIEEILQFLLLARTEYFTKELLYGK